MAAAAMTTAQRRRDDDKGARALRITKRGLAAIQVGDGGAHPEADEHRDTEQQADLAPDKPSRRTAARRKSDGRTSSGQPATALIRSRAG
jgi:hypothetical protein